MATYLIKWIFISSWSQLQLFISIFMLKNHPKNTIQRIYSKNKNEIFFLFITLNETEFKDSNFIDKNKENMLVCY